jgi:predicted ferric reductase
VTTTVASRPAPPRRHAPSVNPRRARDLGNARLVLYAGIVGAAVTIGLWVRHGGIGAATGPGGVATAAGQLFALLGTYAVLVQLLLMSRLPWIERGIGLDRLAVWHRWIGFATLWMLTAHVALTTLGYAEADGISLWAQTRDLISHYPDVLAAWAGFGLLVVVAVTSVRLARKHLRRQTWYFVHLYAYLAVALSFAHQLATGTDFAHDRAARAWWIALYVVVGGAIAWWRVVEPVRRSRRHDLRVHKVEREAPGVVSIVLRGRDLDRLGARPGQFLLWRFLTRDGWWQAHPFSLSAAPTPRYMRITVKSLGDYTGRLQGVRRGTRVFIEGPFGTFTTDRRTRRSALYIAGGIGITPLRALLDSVGPHDDVILLYRVQTNDDVVFAKEIRQLAAERNITVYVITGTEIGDDNTDLLGVPALRRAIPDIASRDCFVCGPPSLIDVVRRRLTMLGVSPRQIAFERFEF